MTLPIAPRSFSDHAADALAQADATRVHFGHAALEPEHILAGLLDVPESNATLIVRNLRVSVDEVRRELEVFLRRTIPVPSGESMSIEGRDVPLGFSGRSVLDRAATLAAPGVVGTEHLLRAVQTLPSPAATLLRTFGVTPEEVERRFVSDVSAAATGPVIDLVERAASGALPPLVPRPALLRELSIRVLAARGRAILLTGDSGSGRRSLVLLLAQALAARDNRQAAAGNGGDSPTPAEVADPLPSHILQPSDSALRANPAEAFRTAAQMATPSAVIPHPPSFLLWVPDIHTYLGAPTRSADVEAGEALREIIRAGAVTVIASTTPDAQGRIVAAEPSLLDSLFLPEPSAEEVLAIVRATTPALAERHQVTIAEDAITAAATLARRYGGFTGAALPGSALHMLERACVEVRLAGVAGLGFDDAASDRTVDAADVALAVTAMTGVTVRDVGAAEAARLAAMEEHLRRRVIGQDEALNALARAVRRARMGFNDPKRPVGSFLFLGGSGVGKTESARALAEFLFGDESQMVRLDMSEYSEKHTVARLIGAPPGYVGYDEGGQLTEALRRRPESLILFDEIEKAHPDVLTILLQILEDGRLTDSKGRTIDFRQAVIIMTSNVGTHLLHNVEGSIAGETKQLLEAELRRYFRVEFINRIDKIIYFHFLAPEDLARILDLMLAKAAARARERGITIEVTPAAKQWLLAQNHEPDLGARPLRRIVQDAVEDALVERLLHGDAHAGQIVRVDTGADGLVFAVEGAAAADEVAKRAGEHIG